MLREPVAEPVVIEIAPVHDLNSHPEFARRELLRANSLKCSLSPDWRRLFVPLTRLTVPQIQVQSHGHRRSEHAKGGSAKVFITSALGMRFDPVTA